KEVIPIQVDLEFLTVECGALRKFFFYVANTCSSEQRREPIHQRNYVVVGGARFDHSRPAHHHGNAETTFPCRTLLTVEHRHSAVRPQRELGSVIGGVKNDGVIGNSQLVELIKELTHMPVVLDHAIRMNALSRDTEGLGLQVRKDVHSSRVEPAKER